MTTKQSSEKPGTNLVLFDDPQVSILRQNLSVEADSWVTYKSRVLTRAYTSGTPSTDMSQGALDLDGSATPADRAYPHIYDQANGNETAMSLIAKAKKAIDAALEYFGDGDFQSMSTQVTLAALSLATAHKHTGFNDSLGSVVSYLRRALLLVNPLEIGVEELHLIAKTLNVLQERPMLSLNEAAGIADALEEVGLQGDLAVVESLISALVGPASEEVPVTFDKQAAEQGD